MKGLKNFIFYNNTIPILFGVLFLGAGATFAASPEARETVVGSSTRLSSVDNSYLLNTVIDDNTVQITIGSVTEDDEKYYVEYQISNIEVIDGAWQPVVRTKTLEVGKDSVMGRDLGLYAAEELAEVHALYVRKLKEYQEIDSRAGITPKVMATEYSGLVGQFFDSSQEVFPAYDPIIDPNVGIPLTKEQEAEHERLSRLAEEVKRKERRQQDAVEEESVVEDINEPDADSGPDPVEEIPPLDVENAPMPEVADPIVNPDPGESQSEEVGAPVESSTEPPAAEVEAVDPPVV